MRRDHSTLMRHTKLCECFTRITHRVPVRLAAHDNSDERRSGRGDRGTGRRGDAISWSTLVSLTGLLFLSCFLCHRLFSASPRFSPSLFSLAEREPNLSVKCVEVLRLYCVIPGIDYSSEQPNNLQRLNRPSACRHKTTAPVI